MKTEMPSPIGHALAGLAIGIAADKPNRPDAPGPGRHIRGMPLVAAAVAALPDADLLIPHFHRMAAHSLGATALVMILAAVVTGKVTGRISWRIVLVLGAAHASHVLMDWLGVDPSQPPGIQVFWPFTGHFYISDWDVFPPTERRLWSEPGALAINTRAFLVEVAIMGPVAVASWLATRRRRSRGRISAPDGRRPPFA